MQILLVLLGSSTEVVSLSLRHHFINLTIHPTDEVLLTPFRTQNVPPPMSSYQLKTSLSTLFTDTPSAQTPVHISLSPLNDLLASVWQDGRISVWSLNTRIGPGKEKVMDPTLVWTAGLRDGEKFWRQVSVSDMTGGEKRTVRVTLLGSEGGFDHVTVHEISIADARDDKPERDECFLVKMTGVNGRLIASYVHLPLVWQDIKGEIFEGRVTFGLVSSFFFDISASGLHARNYFATLCLSRALLLGDALRGG